MSSTPEPSGHYGQRLARRGAALAGPEHGNDADLVFVREDGQPINPNDFSKWFDQRVKRAALPRITFHGLRHSYVTMLLRGASRSGSSPNERDTHRRTSPAPSTHTSCPGDDEAAALQPARTGAEAAAPAPLNAPARRVGTMVAFGLHGRLDGAVLLSAPRPRETFPLRRVGGGT